MRHRIGRAFALALSLLVIAGVADAQKWAADARAQSEALERAIADGKWDDAKAAAGTLQQACSACHGAYRERLDDGSYRIRTESK